MAAVTCPKRRSPGADVGDQGPQGQAQGVSGRAEAGRGHLTSSQLGAATHALRLPLWALVSDVRAY